mmetsp:Transcript_7475/g.33733  ORF Transcript_7475/g.33733 Transcript_7475/m.33733 type:complete len:236 (-) Transcript_7475:5416-6123(-)
MGSCARCGRARRPRVCRRMDATGTEAREKVQVLFRRLFSTARLRGRIPLVFGRNGTCTGTTGTWKTSPRRRRADLGNGGWAAGGKATDWRLETPAGGKKRPASATGSWSSVAPPASRRPPRPCSRTSRRSRWPPGSGEPGSASRASSDPRRRTREERRRTRRATRTPEPSASGGPSTNPPTKPTSSPTESSASTTQRTPRNVTSMTSLPFARLSWRGALTCRWTPPWIPWRSWRR